MSGRHAAAVDVDDEALAGAEPAHPGAHRADGEPPTTQGAPRGKRTAKPPAAEPPTASPAPRRRAAQRKDTA